MGIDITVNGVVSFNPNHEKFVSTSVSFNPKLKNISVKGYRGNLLVYSVFTRMKSNDNRDGNPLIYAMKGLKGYSITFREIVKFKKNFKDIMGKVINHNGFDCDVILVIPSSSSVVKIFARLVGFITGKQVIDDYFEKCTIDDVLINFNMNIVSKKDEDTINGIIYTLTKLDGTKHFTLKHVRNNVRHYFQPLKVRGGYNLNGKKILLVDDVLSTGTTFINAHKLISNSAQKIIAMSFLSDLSNY
ncbi:hypothetical protein ACNZ3Z_17345 [Enterobacter kobei]|uniref:hypothetical protein n=1 Tax=Enterobacter kobei TaxID=208224 RepID=UPI003B8F62A0|nr:hypothetical protein [Escherichia coli]